MRSPCHHNQRRPKGSSKDPVQPKRKKERTLLYDPTIPLLGTYPEKIITAKDTCTPMFIAAVFTRARTGRQPRHSSADEWIKKWWYIYKTEYYSAIKRMNLSH